MQARLPGIQCRPLRRSGRRREPTCSRRVSRAAALAPAARPRMPARRGGAFGVPRS